MLSYKGRIIHDSACACCVQVPLTKDARQSKVDPTGTVTIRRAMAAEMALRWRGLRPLLRKMLVDLDMLGLGTLSLANVFSPATVTGGPGKVQAFQGWFDNLLRQQVLNGDGAYLRPYIQRSYDKGIAFGEQQAGKAVLQFATSERASTIAQLAIVELQGVMEAVSQQAVRAATQGILAKQKPTAILRNIMQVVTKVGIMRSNTISEFTTIHAFGEGTLDVYQNRGVNSVGLIPEAAIPRQLGDARRVQSKYRKGAGSRISRTRAPSRRTVQRIRKQEQRVEKLEAVRVRTAGDENVCPVCEEIAEEGPYPINTARTLIPAHPRCRCAFVPADDQRFAEDMEAGTLA